MLVAHILCNYVLMTNVSLNGKMAAVVSRADIGVNMSGHIQNQLTKSLERILEDANLSGELKLSGRKLKDFPKTGKYDLSDTVIADLSKNRFGDVPDEVTTFYFLERLQLYHNAIRSIPDTIAMLQSLTYLDLSRNQLTEVPRELCSLPLQVLLLSHNGLKTLPKEIGKMQTLAELDAASNLINQLPMSIGDLRSLRALNLKSNQLGLLPLQITFLQLEMLDVSCNCISSLPLELRNMISLVVLNLDNNPLVSPPATVCVRGRIHIFKYLENQAMKDTIHRRGLSAAADEHLTRRPQQPLRSTSSVNPNTTYMSSNGGLIGINQQTPLCPPAVEGLRHKARYHVDSGYSTSDSGEKRWSSDGVVSEENAAASGRSTPSTPSTLSPSPALASSHHNNNSSTNTIRSVTETPPSTPLLGNRISPDGANSLSNGDDKSKLVNHQQTYRQYKEAQRQQRQQDVYRPRGETSPATSTPSPGTPGSQSHSTPNTLTHSPQYSNGYSQHRSIGSSSPSLISPNQSNNNLFSSPRKYPTSATPTQPNGLPNHNSDQYNVSANSYLSNSSPQKLISGNSDDISKRPVQKVVPSRSNSMTTKSTSPTEVPHSNSNNSILNGNNGDYSGRANQDNTDGYIKPVSPVKGSSSYMTHNNVPMNRSNSLGRTTLDSPSNHINGGSDPAKLLTTSLSYVGTSPTSNQPRINWNKEVPPDKLSFTMKREFDRAREESELIQQLRSILENRLKMTLPRDLASVLSDGVVLCHLANNVRPRAVASVHVPSPAQPKLTMARCRRNVDNFLEACRRIGVEEGLLCKPQDILHPQEDSERSLEAVYITITQLLATASKKLMCCAADVLEGKGLVQVAITVVEVHRRQTEGLIGVLPGPRKPPIGI